MLVSKNAMNEFVDENGEITATLTLDQIKQIRMKKNDLMKRFLNKKALLTQPESVQNLKSLPFIYVE